MTMKLIWTAAFLACLPLWAAGADEDSPDGGKFQGTYTIVRGERDGKPLPKGDLEGSSVTITKDKILGTDKDRKEFFACTYTLDTTTKPWVIRMKSTAPKAGEKSEGVVEVKDDAVKICYNLPGGKPPATFNAGEKQHCFELRRSSR
jgi:uncharacterized protein (TIGR03067 family)